MIAQCTCSTNAFCSRLTNWFYKWRDRGTSAQHMNQHVRTFVSRMSDASLVIDWLGEIWLSYATGSLRKEQSLVILLPIRFWHVLQWQTIEVKAAPLATWTDSKRYNSTLHRCFTTTAQSLLFLSSTNQLSCVFHCFVPASRKHAWNAQCVFHVLRSSEARGKRGSILNAKNPSVLPGSAT